MLLRPVSERILHVEAVHHEGKVVLVATDARGTIWYSVKQDGFEDTALSQSTAVEGWENWRELEFPAEPDDPSVLARERAELSYEENGSERFLLRSRYATGGQSAVAPVRLLSAMGHLYVFRQAKARPDLDPAGQPRVTARSLLVDRYVLDGLTNVLGRKLDVRFKRSRQKYEPFRSAAPSRRLSSLDSMDFSDTNDRPFFEPTTELTLIDKLAKGERGWFSVVLVPTVEHDRYRWHLFAANDREETVELVSLRASEEGLFDLGDQLVLDPEPQTVPGIVRRTLELRGPDGPLGPPTGLGAVQYDLQSEQATGDGTTRLLRDAVRVLLAVPTAGGKTATLAFGVDGFGQIAEIDERPSPVTLRGNERRLLLPLDTLDEIRAVGDARPLVEGAIRAFARDAQNRDRVLVTAERAGELTTGDQVRIRGTAAYNGHYEVAARIDDNTFEVEVPVDLAEAAGRWQKVEEEGAGQVFEGLVTGYEQLPGGRLRVTAFGHGLEQGDGVQISETADYDETYPVVRVDADRFALPRRWQQGEARGVVRERRGVSFEGPGDRVEIAELSTPDPATEDSTVSAWVYLEPGGGRAMILGRTDRRLELSADGGRVELKLRLGEARLWASDEAPTGRWVHYAATVRHSRGADLPEIQLFRDGRETGDLGFSSSDVLGGSASPLEPGLWIGGGRIKIAEVQVWSKTRTAREIRDTMHLQLTGHEPALEAYWRLGAIFEAGDHPTVVDFASGGHDGRVVGTPYVSARTLERLLPLTDEAGRRVAANAFVNEELVAVSQRSVYQESFELRPLAADGQVVAPDAGWFHFDVWGKSGRRSTERLPETPLLMRPTIEALPDGWFRASATYTVPEGARLLRVFGIALDPDMAQPWETMEVRRHAITLTSDTVSRADLHEVIALASPGATAETQREEVAQHLEALAGRWDEQFVPLATWRRTLAEEGPSATLRAIRETLAQLEVRRLDRIAAKGSIQDQIDQLASAVTEAEIRQKLAEKTTQIRAKQAEVDQKAEEYGHWADAPIALSRQVILYTEPNFAGVALPLAPGFHNVAAQGGGWDNNISSVRVPHGLQVVLFDDDRQYKGDLVTIGEDRATLGTFDNRTHSVHVRTTYGAAHYLEQLTPRIELAANDLRAARNELATLERVKRQLMENLEQGESSQGQLIAQRDARLRELGELSQVIRPLHDLGAQILAGAVSEPLALAPLAGGGASQTTVDGILLDFGPAKGTSSFVATNGNVELHGFDAQGRAVRREFDAAADSGSTTFEEWLPSSSERACFDAGVLTVGRPIPLGPEWTIEAWLETPLATVGARPDAATAWTPARRSLVVRCSDPEVSPIVIEGSRLGTRVDGTFQDSGYDLSELQQSEGAARSGKPRWIHLAAVGKGGATTFYVDGQEAGSRDLRKARQELRSLESGPPQEAKRLADVEEQLAALEVERKPDAKKIQELSAERDTLSENKSVKVPAERITKLRAQIRQGRPQVQCRRSIEGFGSREQPLGPIAEVRVWRTALTEEEIAANSRVTLSGNEPDLEAYLRLDEATGTTVRDATGNGHDGTIESGQWALFNGELGIRTDLPAGTPAVAEYSTFRIDPATGARSSMMRRLWAYPHSQGVEVLSGQRVETLELVWVGNAQFQPTLLGYIEGAPPVPTENLTVEESYSGATSVELTMSEDVEFSWTRDQEAGLGASFDLFVGVDQEVEVTESAGLGVEVGISEDALGVRAGVAADLTQSYNYLNSSSVSAASGRTVADKLELRGTREREAKFPQLGPRFVPKNVGYALVVSALADLFITRLARSRRMISYQVLPIPEIPPDVNTITFLINPAYTMQGSLDGLTGSAATSDRFFRHVPAMRAQYGSLYPASYFRLQEAYALRQQIEYRDKAREAYFRQFNARNVTESALDGVASDSLLASANAPISVPASSASGDSDPEIERLESRIRELEAPDRARSAAEDAELAQAKKDLDEKSKARRTKSRVDNLRNQSSSGQTHDADERQEMIARRSSDAQQTAHATASFASWQRKMEGLQVLAGKRNIANTYVWDADGGLHAESEHFANTVEHTIGGSLSLDAGVGADVGLKAFGVGFELTAKATVHLTQTMTKTESRSTGFELNVDLGALESSGITDHDDRPILPGEKVDRYRFTSFYLEGSTENYNDFWSHVVDPEWLASNREESRALRQARGKPNKAWRVLHRVTYVERPALAGFGLDLRALPEDAAEDASKGQAEVLARLESLEGSVARLVEALPRPRTRHFGAEELRRLEEAIAKSRAERRLHEPALAAIELMVQTGRDARETLGLRWEWVDLGARRIRIPEKAGQRTIQLNDHATSVLAGIALQAGSPWVFHGSEPGKRLVSIRSTWDALCRTAGIEGVTPSVLRQTAGSALQS